MTMAGVQFWPLIKLAVHVWTINDGKLVIFWQIANTGQIMKAIGWIGKE